MSEQSYSVLVIYFLAVQEDPDFFLTIPCVDIYEKIDLRVRNFNVPPQEVFMFWSNSSCHVELLDICHGAIRVQSHQYNRIMHQMSFVGLLSHMKTSFFKHLTKTTKLYL